MRLALSDIQSDYAGFDSITRLYAQAKDCAFSAITLDLAHTYWLDANMCAPLGAALYGISRNLNTITIGNVPAPVEAILSRNGFLCSYGRERRKDSFGTTIDYNRFEPDDDRYFGHYIETHLVGKGIPKMSPGLLKKFRESIFEIFSNAVIHSRTKHGIFSCGQYFPKAHRLDFSIADLGIGIARNLREAVGLQLSSEDAISWAVEGKNTTKTGPIPGGLGLKLLREFIEMNQGRIQIVSDCGYWELARGKVMTRTLPNPFPGTVVNIEINAADTKSYWLASEMRPEDIF